MFRRVPVDYERERWFTPDDDFLDLDWTRNGSKSLVVLLHGLEGSTYSQYIRGSTALFSSDQWDVLALNFRSCSGEINKQLKMYHHGDYDDVHWVIQKIVDEYDYQWIGLVGFSLGGNVLIKYFSEQGQVIPKEVAAGVAISVPCDLHSSSEALDEFRNILYTQRFRQELKLKMKLKEEQYPTVVDTSRWKEVKNWKDFDNIFTCSIYPFRDALEYYEQGSANQYLESVNLPCLIINAYNDPFLREPSYPTSIAEKKPNIFLELPKFGGHVGFLEHQKRYSYVEERALHFLTEMRTN